MSPFVEWLDAQLRWRNWAGNELARRAGVSPASVSQVMTGQQRPGVEFCRSVAGALNESPVKVFRLAGLLPPEPERDDTAEEILLYYSQMSPSSREHFRLIARAFADGKLRSGDEVVS